MELMENACKESGCERCLDQSKNKYVREHKHANMLLGVGSDSWQFLQQLLSESPDP